MPKEPQDLYDEEPDDQHETLKADQESDTEPVGLLPKSVLQGKTYSVGDTVTFKITGIHDDQIEVSPSGSAEPKEAEDSEETEMEDEMEGEPAAVEGEKSGEPMYD